MYKKFLLIIPCLILILVIKISGSWGLADLESQKAHAAIYNWQNDIDSFSTEDWNKTFSYAKAALEKDPENPELLSLLGNVYEWNSFQSDDQLQNYKNRKLALQHYREAVHLRPQWPYAWVNIALLKLRMNELDQEFHSAFSYAMEFGPWEPKVQTTTAEIGLSVWDKLEHVQRIKIVENIRRGVSTQPQPVLNILKKYGQLKLVCYGNNKEPFVEQYCKK